MASCGGGVLDGDAAVALGGGGELALGLERQAGVVQRGDDVARLGPLGHDAIEERDGGGEIFGPVGGAATLE